MATVLANDVISYCNNRGFTVFTCSLDAQGAFDSIPHCIILNKSINVVTNHCWRLIHNWYESTSVKIRFNCETSQPIPYAQALARER